MPKKGYKQTPEAIANRVASHIGWRKTGKTGYIKNGYHFIQDGSREIGEHRHIMEQFLGRHLDPSENVHHINGDTLDNRIENLQIVSTSEHNVIHNTGKSRKGNKVPPCTEEAKRKIGEANKRIWAQKLAEGYKFPPISDETRRRKSEAQKRRWGKYREAHGIVS